MRDLSYLQRIIGQRSVGVMLHGKSIEALEDHIYALRDKDICWVSLGVFPMMEEFILSKIGKKLEIVLDCATVDHARTEFYELKVRVPKLKPFLSRKEDNLWITTHGLVRDSVKPFYPYFLDKYESKMLLIDSIFPQDNIPKWMDVPNSATFLIASVLAGGASKVFVFGLDGYTGDITKGVDFYYQRDLIIKERLAVFGRWEDPGINRDTDYFETRFKGILEEYRNLFGNQAPVYNCSPVTVYTVLPKITYEQLEEKLSE